MPIAINAQTPIGDPDEPEWDDDDSDEDDIEEEEEDEDPVQVGRHRVSAASRSVEKIDSGKRPSYRTSD